MYARHRNTLARIFVALCAALALGALAGCGSTSRPSAQALIQRTFDSQQEISSGQIALSLDLTSGDGQSASPPVHVRVTGPFQSDGGGSVPRFALAVQLASSQHTLHTGAIFTGSHLYLMLQGVPFVTPQNTVSALRDGFAKATRQAISANGRRSTGKPGPGNWLTDPRILSSANVEGQQVIHLTAQIDLERFFADASQLAGAGSSAGVAADQLSGLLSRSSAGALIAALRSVPADIYTGAEDHLLRRLVIHTRLDTSAATSSALRGSTLDFDLRFSQVNRPQSIGAPSNPHPISELLRVLRELFGEQAAAAETGLGQLEGALGGASAGDSTEYQRCVREAAQNVSALQRCSTLLG